MDAAGGAGWLLAAGGRPHHSMIVRLVHAWIDCLRAEHGAAVL